jgi:hypothetical protein
MIDLGNPSVDVEGLCGLFREWVLVRRNGLGLCFDVLDVMVWAGARCEADEIFISQCFLLHCGSIRKDDLFESAEELIGVWVMCGLVRSFVGEFGVDRWRFVEE